MKFEIIKNSINDTYWLGLYINKNYRLTDRGIAASLDIPWNTYCQLIRTKDVISLKEIKKSKGVFKELSNELKRKEAPAWLSLNKDKLEAKTIGEPNIDEVKPPAEISLIFEFYSR